jgi:parallel beta-helix repeat protein
MNPNPIVITNIIQPPRSQKLSGPNTINYLSITAKASENMKAELKNMLLRQNMKRLISRLILSLVFCSVLFSSPRTYIPNTNGPIYIRADGTVDPSTASISSTDNVTYTFSGNINNSIVVERSNIIIDGMGCTLQGSGLGKAFDLSGVNNVTIKSTDISARKSGRDAHPNYGIYLYSSSFNTISGNNITDNWYAGIYLGESSNNNIIGNNITKNYHGIYLQYSSNSTMVGNNITNNEQYGVVLDSSSNNTMTENNITNNHYGIGLLSSYNSKFHHNNFMGNIQQVYFYDSGYSNVWDDGYPSGGNYWSDYTGADVKSGSNQDQFGSDGIGDTARSIDTSSVDRFPLMAPISIFDAGAWDDLSCKVHVISSSTVSDFQLNEAERIMVFNVAGEIGVGFCRVTIPNIMIQNMWQGNYAVLVDGEKPLDIRNWTDSTSTYIYFTYLHSEHEVAITPEFPVATILPLFIIITLCGAVLTKKKIKP